MAEEPRCERGHKLHEKEPRPVRGERFRCGAVSGVCHACDRMLGSRERRLKCKKCKGYVLCMSCVNTAQPAGEGTYTVRFYVPPGVGSGDIVQVETPSGKTTDICLPGKVFPGAALDVRYDLSPRTTQEFSTEREMAAVIQKQSALAPHCFGYRWLIVVIFGLAQILTASSGWYVWLPADKVLVGSGRSWGLCLVLVISAVLSALPLKNCGMLRFASAAVQGYILGHLLVLDASTSSACLGFVAMLGLANALDRVGEAAEVMPATLREPEVGALGTLDVDGQPHRVKMTAVGHGHVVVEYVDQPVGRKAQEAVAPDDPRLVFVPPTQSILKRIVSREICNGFKLRPWGFCIGAVLSQWAFAGLSPCLEVPLEFAAIGPLAVFAAVAAATWLVACFARACGGTPSSANVAASLGQALCCAFRYSPLFCLAVAKGCAKKLTPSGCAGAATECAQRPCASCLLPLLEAACLLGPLAAVAAVAVSTHQVSLFLAVIVDILVFNAIFTLLTPATALQGALRMARECAAMAQRGAKEASAGVNNEAARGPLLEV